MKIQYFFAIMPLLVQASPVHAGTLYRCVRGGEVTFGVSSLAEYRCDAVQRWTTRDPLNVDQDTEPVRSRTLAPPLRGPLDAIVASKRVDAGLDAAIRRQAQHWRVDESLVRAIIHAESAFNPKALSAKGAMGLMQLMPATAHRFGVRNAYDPEQNIRGGVQYLAWLLRRFKGDWRLAIAGYNAGEGAVDRYAGVPPYRETRAYLAKVWRLSQSYRRVQRK